MANDISQKEKEELKLIYVHKVGHNLKGEMFYEFVFSKDPTNIDYKIWGWDLSPASENAEPPSEDYFDISIPLETDKLNLKCLHEDNEHPYMHGYYNVIALAYESEDEDGNYEEEYEDSPLVVFHYGISFETVENKLEERGIRLIKNKFINPSKIKF